VSSVAGGSKRLRDSSDDGDVRAYVVATLGWLRYVMLEAARGEDALRHVDEYESFATRDFMEASAKIESLHCVRRGLLAKSCSSCLVRSPCFNRSRKSRNVLVLKYR